MADLQGMCEAFLEALAADAGDRTAVGCYSKPIAEAAGIPKEMREAVVFELRAQRHIQIMGSSPQGQEVVLTPRGLARAYELRTQPPEGCLKCCRAIVHLDRMETSLGMGLQVADVVRLSRLGEAAVRRCLGFLGREGLLKEAAFEGRGDFLVSDREQLEYFMDEHLGARDDGATGRFEITMGDTYKQTITNSTVGAAAVGPSAQATGSVGASMDRAAWLASLQAAQAALVRDQDKLDDLAEGMYEAFSQLLRIARQIQVDQVSAAEVQKQVKDAVDDLWSDEQIRKLRGSTLRDTLEVVKALAGPAKVVAEVLLA